MEGTSPRFGFHAVGNPSPPPHRQPPVISEPFSQRPLGSPSPDLTQYALRLSITTSRWVSSSQRSLKSRSSSGSPDALGALPALLTLFAQGPGVEIVRYGRLDKTEDTLLGARPTASCPPASPTRIKGLPDKPFVKLWERIYLRPGGPGNPPLGVRERMHARLPAGCAKSAISVRRYFSGPPPEALRQHQCAYHDGEGCSGGRKSCERG